MASSKTMDLEGWALRSIQTAIGREFPALQSKIASSRVTELRQEYFRLFRLLECSFSNNGANQSIYAAYRQDNSSVVVLTGRQQALRLIAAISPVAFRSADDVFEFAAFADLLTSEEPGPITKLTTADELKKFARGDVSAIQAQFRDRIQPVERTVLPYGLQERLHLISTNRLIERTRMIASGGIFFRQDEVLAENLPIAR
jgi:hypothetical protein